MRIIREILGHNTLFNSDFKLTDMNYFFSNPPLDFIDIDMADILGKDYLITLIPS